MKRKLPNVIVIFCQFLLVGLFFVSSFRSNIKLERYVSTIHNENLNKIATSVSLLFKDEMPVVEVSENINESVTQELPSSDLLEEPLVEVEKKVVEEEIISVPLVSVDASKYINKEDKGFKVTEGNKEYTLTDDEFDVVVAVVSGEFDKNKDDALAVVSVILNRCDSSRWSSWAGKSPYSQVIKAGQFEVYTKGYYLAYMPGGSRYGSEKYNIAKQAVIDGLNGIRNNKYESFRSWDYNVNGQYYSDLYIVYGGNRYK